MRIIYFSFCVLFFLGCNNVSNKKTSDSTEKEIVQIPQEILGKDLEGNEIMVGKISLAQLSTYATEWYQKEYDFYKVNQTLLSEIKTVLKDQKVTLIMGTWCEDSQREVPGMIKILNMAGYPTSSMEIIAVDEDKTTPKKLEKPYDLVNVPTLIFSENGTEINRIVEFPINGLEGDILAILSGDDYKNAYAE